MGYLGSGILPNGKRRLSCQNLGQTNRGYRQTGITECSDPARIRLGSQLGKRPLSAAGPDNRVANQPLEARMPVGMMIVTQLDVDDTRFGM